MSDGLEPLDEMSVNFIFLQLSLANALAHMHDRKRKQRRRWWVHPLNQRRIQQGDFHNLLQEMREDDPQQFVQYMRMTVSQFDYLVHMLESVLHKCSNRSPLPTAMRLAVTIRFLATGDSIPSIAWSFRIGKSTCCNILKETTQAIWDILHEQYLPSPSEEDYRIIAKDFNELWNMPNCIGAIDGKHIVIQAPNDSGSQYYNYKKSFSVVLMAVCDAHYCFTYVDIGAYGSQSDGGIFHNCELGRRLRENILEIPPPEPFPNSNYPFPYFFVGDEAFPLKMNIMRPFSKSSLSSLKNKIFNYRLSRARRVIENTFGIMVARWRIFHRVINAKPENVDGIVKAVVCLHNFLKRTERDSEEKNYCPTNFVDRFVDGQIETGEWRHNVPRHTAFEHVRTRNLRMGARNSALQALQIRERMANYFISTAGAIDGQTEYINRGLAQ